MSDDRASLQRQLANLEENLRLLQERKTEFVLSSEIPLQLLRDERTLQQQIAQMRSDLAGSPEPAEGSGEPASTRPASSATESFSESASPESENGHGAAGTGATGAGAAGTVDQRSGGNHVQGNERVEIGRDLVQANSVDQSTSNFFSFGLPAFVITVLTVSAAMVAVSLFSGYNLRTFLQDMRQAAPLPEAAVSFTGVWQLTYPDIPDEGTRYWQITPKGDSFAIYVADQIPADGAWLENGAQELAVSNLAADDTHLAFTVTGGPPNTTGRFELQLTTPDRMEGTYLAVDAASQQTAVILTRQSE